MTDNPFFPLSFIAGPAILTNACAILQNGATMRYNLAITQWREFQAARAAQTPFVSHYADPQAAMDMAERRIRLLLRGLGLLNVAVALFGATAILGLAGAFLIQMRDFPADRVSLVMVAAGGAGLVFLLAATITFFREGLCGRAMLALHPPFAPGLPPERSGDHVG